MTGYPELTTVQIITSALPTTGAQSLRPEIDKDGILPFLVMGLV